MSAVALSCCLFYSAQARHLMLSGVSLEKALDTVSEELSSEERAGTQSLTYAATRHHLACEALLHRLAQREPSAQVKALLLVALAQLLEDPSKAYVIVNETIIAAKAGRTTAPAVGFINACLRRFGRERQSLLESVYASPSVLLNTPDWWMDRLAGELGVDRARAVLEVQQKKPPLTLRVNRRRTTPEAWCTEAAKYGIESRPIGKSGVLLSSPVPVCALFGFREGLVSVQDAGAQLAAEFLAPRDSEHILDACAAPGGKTAHLLESADACVTAIEKDPQRTQRIYENLHRLGLSARVITADAADTDSWWDGTAFDSILLDAPCTASGIVRRHPDIVFSRQPQDIENLAIQQKKLLNALWPLLKFGGKLLYVVCSVFEAEGKQQMAQFLEQHADAHPTPLGDGLPAALCLLPCENESGSGQGLADTHDGFFYALLTKK